MRVAHDYKINEKVHLFDNDIKRKLAVKTGPFKIVKVNNNGTVTIQKTPLVTETVNLRRLHPVFE